MGYLHYFVVFEKISCSFTNLRILGTFVIWDTLYKAVVVLGVMFINKKYMLMNFCAPVRRKLDCKVGSHVINTQILCKT